jgi:NitT/TauT family transport system substrate-binding protein
VLTKDGFETFLRKPDADAFASDAKGEVMDYESALATIGS